MSPKKLPKKRRSPRRATGGSGPTVGVRIVGGTLRGRKLHYTGDPRTRPMKDRVREAIFNVLGPAVRGKHALDLFAGTGALGLEALSRGAARATLIEQHHPTAAALHGNIAELGVADVAEVVTGNVFLWLRRSPKLPTIPWLVFCSPPYDFYVDRPGDMLQLLGTLLGSAPCESIFVVEADERFDFGLLSDPQNWDIRVYPPARVGIWQAMNEE